VGIYLLRRILQAIPLLIGITMISFLIMNMAPGGPASMELDPKMTQEDRERAIQSLGLDDPLPVQYVRWLGKMVTGDWGTSFVRNADTMDLIMTRLPLTLLLMGISFLLASIISIPFGVISATRKNTSVDYITTITAFLGLATPNFWMGLMLIMLFSVMLGWLPAGGVATLNAPFSITDRILHLIMPAFVLATADMAATTRFTRASMLEVIRQDYIRTAKAKGIRNMVVVYKHALRNALIPIVTIWGLSLPTFFGGALITEQVFGWPGIGKLFIDSVFMRDYPVIMAITTIAAVLVVIGNLLADICYSILDPRIDYK
jgi:peptide/nickel transport system permease protein